jgi:hypothetical protein
MKIIINQIITIFISYLLFFPVSVKAIDWFGGDGEKEGIIWSSGLNRYIKYAEQDESKFGQNEHPVELNKKELQLALRALGIPDDSFFASDEETKTIFTVQQIQLLSEQLPKALKNAKPDQDIIYVLESVETKLLGLKEKAFIAGRIFFKEGKLNIIFGEYNFFRNEAFEKAYDPGGQSAVPYNFNLGKRAKASKAFKGIPVTVTGIENKKLNEMRYDWFVINVKVAAEAYVAQKNKIKNPATKYDKQLEVEATKLAKQRREMRAEMARMRKEVQAVSKGSSSIKSIEERMATLDQLLGKKLITQEEYDSKRQEILNDI